MRKLMLGFGAWLVLCMFATIAAAQGTGRIDGEVIGLDGQPYAEKTVLLKNPETGQTFTLKTDKNGKFTQLALRTAVYVVTLPDIPYSEKFQINDGQDNNYKLNLKDLAAATAALGASTTEKAPPCGSSRTTIQEPPGTSIGPCRTRPPPALTPAAALVASGTRA